MKHIISILLIMVVSCTQMEDKPTAPVAEVIPFEISTHGDIRIDNYYWLRERESDKVIRYLEAENSYTDQIMKPTAELQQELYDEMVAKIPDDEQSLPYFRNGYWYYTRYEKELNYPVYCRKKGSLDAEEEVIMDVNQMAEGFDYYNVSYLSISPNAKIMAYGVDTVSRRKYTIYFKNLETGETYPETIPTTSGGGAWADDNKTFFYTVKDDATLRAYLIKRHKLGSDVAEDVEIFEEKDDTYSCGVYRSFSDQLLYIRTGTTLADEYHFLKSDNPDGEFQVIQPRIRGLEYSVAEDDDEFYILTNKDSAINFKVMKVGMDSPGMENWKEWIPHRPEVQLTDVTPFKNFIAVEERADGYNSIRILSEDKSTDKYIKFDEEAYTIGLAGGAQYEGDVLRYSYNSMTTPYSIFSYNYKTEEKELLKQDEVKGGFDPELYESKRLYATARDGVKVPISLVYKKDMLKGEPQPLLLYGYGSYGSTIMPRFSSTRTSLLDRGFVFAIAHIRGSQMMGREWYENGKMFKKMNTFTDFIDCGKFLIEEGYTNSDHLYAQGGSAGGLLMGAVVNLAPDLFNGVIAAVPFVDVVTTMLDETIPLTTFEYDEWGNPNIKNQYDYIMTYSPYDNVSAQAYPNMLVTTGLHDSQVQYWEPAKWVAKLRTLKTDDNLLLLHTNMEAGHGGASGRLERYKEIARDYSFLLFLEESKN